MKKKVGFIYYTFYPVRGGASVHGFYLARGLSKLGYQLYKLNGDPDPWTTKIPRGLSGLLWILKHCDVIYVRMDHFITNPRNLIGMVALLTGKKVIVELNNPSDELHLFGWGKSYVRFVDRIYRRLLRRAGALIVVSEPLKTYCKQALGLNRISLIENGGEIFDIDAITPADPVRSKLEEIKKKFETVVIWAGSANQMQELKWVREIAAMAGPEAAVLLVVNEDERNTQKTSMPEGDNIFIFRNLDRTDVQYMILSSDVGLAFYKPYPWSRWGFYNSSLKIFEYLNNGLLTLTNIQGTGIQKRYPNFQLVNSPAQAVELIRQGDGVNSEVSFARTWDDVAKETARVIEDVIKA